MKTDSNKRTNPIIRTLIVLLLAVALEVFVFNFHAVRLNWILKCQPETLPLSEAHLTNWSESDNVLVSGEDPMIVFDHVDRYVYFVTLKAKADGDTKNSCLSYTTPENNVFAMSSVSADDINDGQCIAVNAEVAILRIDIGESPGTKLEGLRITLNDVPFHISASRIIAILILYWTTYGLFSLQGKLYDSRKLEEDRHET